MCIRYLLNDDAEFFQTSRTGRSSKGVVEELDHVVLYAIIDYAYETFLMLNGFMANYEPAELRTELKTFFDPYLLTIRFHKLRLYADINGFQYLAVDQSTFLLVQYIVSMLTAHHSGKIQHVCVLYDQRLLLSSLEHKDMMTLSMMMEGDHLGMMYEYLAVKSGYVE